MQELYGVLLIFLPCSKFNAHVFKVNGGGLVDDGVPDQFYAFKPSSR